MSIDGEFYEKIKVIMLGDSDVGKTSIVTRFVDGRFSINETPTIGIDFTGKTMFTRGRPIRVQIWDTAGQERFHSLIPSYIREARGAVIVYDISSRASFEHVNKWVEEVRSKRITEVTMVLVGNKNDKIDRQVTLEEGKELAENLNLFFCEASAKNGHNISYMFDAICTQVVAIKEPLEEQTETVYLEQPDVVQPHSNKCSCS